MKIALLAQNWGFGRGVAYNALAYVKALLALGHEVTVLRFGQLDENAPEFDLPIKKIDSPDFWQVDGTFFKTVLDLEKPDYCLFFEYDQWVVNKNNLIEICWEKGVKPIGAWIAWEKLFNTSVPKFKRFHKIFSHTKEQVKIFRRFGLTNTYLVPFGLDLKEYEGEKFPHSKFVFLHTSGFGGVKGRRNTELVVEAFKKLNDPNTSLILTSQKVANLPYSEIKKLYKKADCYLCPSKWEGLGIPNIEAIISGTPVITTNYPPMNEIVKDRVSGLLVDADDYIETKEIGVAQQIIEVDDLIEKMKLVMNPEIHEILVKGCQIEKERFSQEKMMEALKKELM